VRLTGRETLIAIVVAVMSIGGTLFLTGIADRIGIDWPTTATVFAHLATAGAVLIAGWWTWFTTIHRRSLTARVQFVHRYQVWSDAHGDVLRVFVELRNPSEAMLVPGDGMTYVQTPPIVPIDSSDYSYDLWNDVVAIRHAVTYESIRIEPKETEIFSHDVRLPAGARFVQLYTWLWCEPSSSPLPDSDGTTRPTAEIELPTLDDTWNTLTLVDLAGLKASPAHT